MVCIECQLNFFGFEISFLFIESQLNTIAPPDTSAIVFGSQRWIIEFVNRGKEKKSFIGILALDNNAD